MRPMRPRMDDADELPLAKFEAELVVRVAQSLGHKDGKIRVKLCEDGNLLIYAPDGRGWGIVNPIKPHGVGEDGQLVEKTRTFDFALPEPKGE